MLLHLRRRGFLKRQYEVAAGDPEIAWFRKIEGAPLGILERAKPRAGRSFHAGAGLGPWLQEFARLDNGKIFAVTHDPAILPPGAVRLEPPWLTKLEAFPRRTFDFSALFWPGCSASDALPILASRTKPGGLVAALFPMDASPRLATWLLARALKKSRKRVRMTALGAPRSPGALRRAAWMARLGSVRAWVDGMHFFFPDGAAAFDHFVKLLGSDVFGADVDAKTRREVKEAFAEEAEDYRTPEGIMLTCEFLGVVGTR